MITFVLNQRILENSVKTLTATISILKCPSGLVKERITNSEHILPLKCCQHTKGHVEKEKALPPICSLKVLFGMEHCKHQEEKQIQHN